VHRFAVPGVAVLALLGGAWSCVVSDGSECPGCPPSIGTPHDAGILDVPAPPDIVGPCPGQGTVTLAFDRGTASQTCWSGSSPLASGGGTAPAGEPTVTIAGNPQSFPGLFVGILLYSGDHHGSTCGIGPGSKLALDGPCVSVIAAYGSGGAETEWEALGGASAQGSLVVGSFGTMYGATVSVSFSPGSSIVLDTPDHPLVAISGNVTLPLQ
jgi:hypothetical protein